VIAATALGLAAAGVLGTAGAQDTTSTTAPAPPPPQRLVTVNGAGAVDVAAGAKASDRQAAYRSALTAALDDAKAKAELIAGHEGLTLGAVQSVTEQGNDLMQGCVVAYGATGSGVAVPAPAPALRKAATRKARRHKRRRRATAIAPAPRQAPVPLPPQPYPCGAQAAVTVSYAVS
jgi:uncharacterized protein DUF541